MVIDKINATPTTVINFNPTRTRKRKFMLFRTLKRGKVLKKVTYSFPKLGKKSRFNVMIEVKFRLIIFRTEKYKWDAHPNRDVSQKTQE